MTQTQQKRAPAARPDDDERLYEVRQQLRSIVAATPIVLWAVDTSGVIRLAEGRALTSLGGTSEDLVGQNVFRLYRNFDVVHECIGAALQGEDRTYRTHSQSRDWINHVVPQRSREGEVIGAIGVSFDATEQLATERALREKDAEWRSFLEAAPDLIVIVDADRRVVFSSRADAPVDTPSDERPRAEDFVIPEHRSRVLEALEHVFTTGRAATYDAERVGSDQAPRWIRTRVGPIVVGGKTERATLVIRDITGERAQEAQLRQHQKLEAIGTLAAGVAHEINNPLNGILNYGALIKRGLDPDSPLATFAAGIVEECERIGTIVGNLLSFSRQGQESHQPTDMKAVIEATLNLMRAMLFKDQIAVEVHLDEELPEIVCHRQQVQQVLLNVLSNASDAVNARFGDSPGDKKIRIYARTQTRHDVEWLSIIVEDCGVGVPDAIVERVFDPFFTTKPRDKGTGLGLSVSHGIVAEHRGRMYFARNQDGDTQVHIELPVGGVQAVPVSAVDVTHPVVTADQD